MKLEKQSALFWSVLAVVAIGGGGLAVYAMTRNWRNNNPLNMIDNGINWQGLDSPRNDGKMLRFQSPYHGCRAAALDLAHKIQRGLNTPFKIIEVWAPVSDGNDPVSYADKVARNMGITRNTTVTTDAVGDLVFWMSQVEGDGIRTMDEIWDMKTCQAGVDAGLQAAGVA